MKILEQRATKNLFRFYGGHGDQSQSKVADFHQDPVERCLIGDNACENGRAVAVMRQGESVKPLRAARVEMPFDANVVGLCRYRIPRQEGLGEYDQLRRLAFRMRYPAFIVTPS